MGKSAGIVFHDDLFWSIGNQTQANKKQDKKAILLLDKLVINWFAKVSVSVFTLVLLQFGGLVR